jgi:DNA-binding CsgD family transcriptional regulator
MTRIIFYTSLGSTAPGAGTYGSSVQYSTLLWDDDLPASSLVSAINIGAYRFPLLPQPGPVYAVQYGDMVLVTRPAPGHPAVNLTPREREVLTMLAEGLSLQQISYRLNVKLRTVHIYLARLRERLNAGTREQVVARAVALGLYRPSLP